MTIKDILEDHYGIDFSSLDFKIKDEELSCTKEEILKSLEENELVFDTNNPIEKIKPGVKYYISDADIEDNNKQTTLYWD